MRVLILAAILFAAAVVAAQPRSVVSVAHIMATASPPTLSSFGFFDGSANRPVPGLIRYELNTPLFSDYAEKERFIYLPPGSKLGASADGKLAFPLGSALIKSFGYRGASGDLQIIETRLLLNRANGWVALPYVWRKDGSDADLRVGGTRVPVSFAHAGKQIDISYSVPNKNQCKQCHSSADALVPIGPFWQNMKFERAEDRQRILNDVKMLAKFASEAKWDDTKSGSLDQRATAYLRVNCGHCHAPKGSASNSGLFLDGSAKDQAALGIGKRPVAAGRASGNLDFIIEPGRPERSILINRMKSTDPGIAMPELGRATVHEEGTQLLEQWIAAMPSPASQ